MHYINLHFTYLLTYSLCFYITLSIVISHSLSSYFHFKHWYLSVNAPTPELFLLILMLALTLTSTLTLFLTLTLPRSLTLAVNSGAG